MTEIGPSNSAWLAAFALGITYSEPTDDAALRRLRDLHPSVASVAEARLLVRGLSTADPSNRTRAVRLLVDLHAALADQRGMRVACSRKAAFG